MEFYGTLRLSFYDMLPWTSKGYSINFHGSLESPNKKSPSSMGFYGIRRAPFQMTQVFHGIYICKMGLIIFEEEGGNPPVRCYRRVRLLKAIKPGEKRTEWNSNKMHVSKTFLCKMFARSCLPFRWHHLDLMASNSWGLISLATLDYHYINISGNRVKNVNLH